jgi:hypothetical protein
MYFAIGLDIYAFDDFLPKQKTKKPVWFWLANKDQGPNMLLFSCSTYSFFTCNSLQNNDTNHYAQGLVKLCYEQDLSKRASSSPITQ